MAGPWEKYQSTDSTNDAPDGPWNKYAKPSQPEGVDEGRVAATIGGFNGVFPFGRKITDAIGAGIASAVTGEPYSDQTTLSTLVNGQKQKGLYSQAEDNSIATSAAHPGYSLAGAGLGIVNTLPLAVSKAITGVIPTTGIRGTINAIPEALGAVGDWNSADTFAGAGKLAKAGNFVVQTLKNAATSAPGGAIYGASEAPTGQEAQGAVSGAGIGAGLGAALPAVSSALGNAYEGASNVVKGAFARSPEQLDAAANTIKQASSRAYQAMRDSGATFTPQAKDNIVSSIEDTLKDDGPLNAGLHGNTVSLLSDLKDAAQQPDFSLEQLDQYRRLFSRIPRSQPEDVRKASLVINSLDDAVNGLKNSDLSTGDTAAIDALNQGRQNYATYSKFDRISNIIDNSGGDANKLKSGLQKFANDPRKTRGFSPDEMNALQEAAKNSTGEGLLKLAGKFGIDLGSSLSVGNAGLPAVAAAVTGATSGAGAAGLGVAAGTVARQAQKYVARAKADDLLKLIEQGGNVTAGQVGQLPPSEAMKFLSAIKNNGIALPATALSLKDLQ